MANFTDLLGSLMQSGMSASSTSRATNALGGRSGAGALTDIMGDFGQMLGTGRSGSTSLPGDLGATLGSVMESLGSNKAALGGLGALAGALLGGGGKATRGAVGGGTLAMLASLAFSALQKSGHQPQMPRALLETETRQQQEALEEEAALMVRAMINAAKADGRIDQEELQRIMGKLDDDGLTQAEKDFFSAEVSRPLDLPGIVRSAQGSPEQAAQVYAASLLAIEVDTEAERRYMDELARGLGLAKQTTAFIEQTLGVK